MRSQCALGIALIALGIASMGSPVHAASTAGGPALVDAGRTRSALDFRLEVQPNGSYLKIEFTLRPQLVRATLIAPNGQLIDLTSRLRRLPAEQTRQPDRGDLYLMTDIVRDPPPGNWQLVLEHAAVGVRHTVFWQAVHQPRFAASLSMVGGDRLREGVEVDVLLHLTDYGMPSANVLPGSLALTAPGGGRSTRPLQSTGVTGRYEARVPVQGAGTLELAAEPVWQVAASREARVKVSRRWAVEAGAATPAATLAMQIDRDSGGCWQAVGLTMPWQADAAGTYVLSVLLGKVRITGSNEVRLPGPTVLKASLRGTRLAMLAPVLASGLASNSVREAEIVEIVRASGDSDVLFRRSHVPLSPPIDGSGSCRQDSGRVPQPQPTGILAAIAALYSTPPAAQ